MLIILHLALAASEEVNILGGDWELIPILQGLSPGTRYTPEYIDDISTDYQSTTDLFIFEDGKEVAW